MATQSGCAETAAARPVNILGRSVGPSQLSDSIIFEPSSHEIDPSFSSGFYRSRWNYPELVPYSINTDFPCSSNSNNNRSRLHPGLGRLNCPGQSGYKHHPMYKQALRGYIEPNRTGFMDIPPDCSVYKDPRFHNPSASCRDVPRAWSSQAYKRLLRVNMSENPKPRLLLNTSVLPPGTSGLGNQQVSGKVTSSGKKYQRSSFQHGMYGKYTTMGPAGSSGKASSSSQHQSHSRSTSRNKDTTAASSSSFSSSSVVLVKSRHVRIRVGAVMPDGSAMDSERQTTIYYTDGSSEIIVEKIY